MQELVGPGLRLVSLLLMGFTTEAVACFLAPRYVYAIGCEAYFGYLKPDGMQESVRGLCAFLVRSNALCLSEHGIGVRSFSYALLVTAPQRLALTPASSFV